MKDFFKYLTPSDENKNWGLYMNVVGTTRVPPIAEYPSREHPNGYYFSWKNGRILHEYQINYITEGYGVLETSYGRFQIKPGTIMVTFPGVWHRYRPKLSTGWVENYIGVQGNIADKIFSHPFLDPKIPLLTCGLKENIIDCYQQVFDLAQKEKPGFQMIASGIVIKLVGSLISYIKNKEFKGKAIEDKIEKCRFYIRQNMSEEIDFKKLAKDIGISYSYFRKMFKNFTDVSPAQYQLHLRIIRAKELLIGTSKSIKEISFETGFQSIYYFSRIFKEKTGLTPSELRKITFPEIINK